MTWIGIDIGVTGAIAVIDQDGIAETFPLEYHQAFSKLRFLDTYHIYRLMHRTPEEDALIPPPEAVRLVLIEEPGAYTPNTNVVKQMAHAWGALEMAFADYRNDIVSPQDWQRHYLNGSGRGGWDKRFALELARELFPELEDDLQRVTLDDGRAEALLIANYAREMDDGEG